MPSLIIDGRQVDFTPGETIISAAARDKNEIPHYCWHKHLSVAANCRMCLVEVEKTPNLVPACRTECKADMVVYTKNDRVKAAQKAVHEFLLLNHPIDCPICDQAGECKLQDTYMKLQLAPSPMRDAKVRKHKRTQLGPYVMYDAERCVVCTRCVRFMAEIAGERALGVFNRGNHSVIGTFPGQQLDNPYSLNVVDVCPVGALTSTVFRFKQRVWFLSRSASLCPGCSRGCNVWVDHRAGLAYRLLPRENDAINKTWLCDEGRLTYARANDGRLTRALERAGDARPAETAVKPAFARAVELLRPVVEGKEGKGLAAALSLHATCEQAYVFGRLARDVLKAEIVGLLEYKPGEGDSILRVSDKNPNRSGVLSILRELGLTPLPQSEFMQQLKSRSLRVLLAVGHETSEAAELAANLRDQIKSFVHIAHARSPLCEQADVTLPALSWLQGDGSWVNAAGMVQRLTPAIVVEGEARAAEIWLGELASALGGPLDFSNGEAIRVAMARDVPSLAASFASAKVPSGPVAVSV